MRTPEKELLKFNNCEKSDFICIKIKKPPQGRLSLLCELGGIIRTHIPHPQAAHELTPLRWVRFEPLCGFSATPCK